MSKGLEALERIKREAGTPYFSTLYDIDMWREDFDIVETALKKLEYIETTTHSVLREDISKELKALEIIKKDENLVIAVMSNCKGGEEYDLLKEVLL